MGASLTVDQTITVTQTIRIGPHELNENHLNQLFPFHLSDSQVDALLEFFWCRTDLERVFKEGGQTPEADPVKTEVDRIRAILTPLLNGLNAVLIPEAPLTFLDLNAESIGEIITCLLQKRDEDIPEPGGREDSDANETHPLSLEIPLGDGTLLIHRIGSIRNSTLLIKGQPLFFYILSHYTKPGETPIPGNLPEGIQDLLRGEGGDYLVTTFQAADGGNTLLRVSRGHNVVDVDAVLGPPYATPLSPHMLLPRYSILTHLRGDTANTPPRFALPLAYLEPTVLIQDLANFLGISADDFDDELRVLSHYTHPYDLMRAFIQLTQADPLELTPEEEEQRTEIEESIGAKLSDIFPTHCISVSEIHESTSPFFPGASALERENNFHLGLLGELCYNLNQEGFFTIITVDEFYMQLLERIDGGAAQKSILTLSVAEGDSGKQFVVVINNENMVAHLKSLDFTDFIHPPSFFSQTPPGIRPLKQGLDLFQIQQDVAYITARLAAVDCCEPESPLEEFENELLQMVNDYHAVAQALTPAGHCRNLTKMLAWARQAGQAVCPEYLTETESDPEMFQFFIETCVIFVILLEDVGETLKGPHLEPLMQVIAAIAHQRIQAPTAVDLHSIPGFCDLAEPQKKYAQLVNRSFSLLYKVLDQFSSPSKKESDPEEGTDPEDEMIGNYMREALKEMFDMIVFNQQFDRVIRGQEQTVLVTLLSTGHDFDLSLNHLPQTEDYIRQNQSNLFMRYMLLASFLQHWKHMDQEKRWVFNFETLVKEVNQLGLMIEALGRIANDMATFFRELMEGSASNSLFIDAFAKNIISPSDMIAAFDQIQHFPHLAQPLLQKLSTAIFSDTYSPTDDEWQIQDPKMAGVLALVNRLHENDIFYESRRNWDRKLEEIRVEFEGSSLCQLIDLEHFLQQQFKFLNQYLQANGLV